MNFPIHKAVVFSLSFLLCSNFLNSSNFVEDKTCWFSPDSELNDSSLADGKSITFDLDDSEKEIVKTRSDVSKAGVSLIDKTEKLHVNNIRIIGNKNVKDRIIMRQIEFKPGDKITAKKLRNSLSNLEFLNLFERNSVSINVVRLDVDNQKELFNSADIEIIVSEKSPGELQLGVGYGSTARNPVEAVTFGISLKRDNLFGNEWSAGVIMTTHKDTVDNVGLRFSNSNVFDKNLFSEIGLYQVYNSYSGWGYINKFPFEKYTGGYFKLGFPLDRITRRLKLYTEFGTERIKNNGFTSDREDINDIIYQRFREDVLNTFSLTLEKDTRNHPVEPSSGYRAAFSVKTALPSINDDFSFLKNILSVESYTSLIGKDKLVLDLHGFAGSVHSLKNDSGKKIIPYKELFHMGGLHSVRGFSWGELDPSLSGYNPLGGRYALQGTSDLVLSIIDKPNLPLLRHFRLKGHLFYDFGGCWNTIKKNKVDTGDNLDISLFKIRNNKFKLRHSIGWGISLLKPLDLRFSWAYKLGRRPSETKSEIHLTTNFTW